MRKLVMALLCAVMAAHAPGAFAQSPNGIVAGQPVIGISYYKVEPGKHDEWLALFHAWHYPLIQEMKKEGTISDFKLLIPNVHGMDAGWDFAGITFGGTGSPKVKVGTAQRIRQVFPDLAAFEKGEKERWSLTTGHWDELTSEIDLNSSPLSLYAPVGK